MRPTDPVVRRQLTPARRELAGVLVAGAAQSLLLVGQAFAVTALVLAALNGDDLTAPAVAVVAVYLARAGAGWLGDLSAAQAAVVVGTDVRRGIVAAVQRGGAPRPTGELTVLATRGVTAAEPYLTRYLPALVLAVVLPSLILVVIATQDVLSAVIVLVTLPLVPVFGILVGLATQDRARTQWQALASLSGHFLDVMRGLPTLVAYRRAEAQSDTIRSITDRYRRRTMDTLRIAFASSAVLELVATVSVAVLAVTVGLRLAAGTLDLRTAMVVLLLAPEAYWPLRRVGAEFHAAAEGVATYEASAELVDGATGEALGDPAPPVGPITVDGLVVVRPGRTVAALDGVSFEIPARGVTAVVGPSGCGKSTLLEVLAGLLAPSQGSVLAGGRPVGGSAWRSQVALLPQRPVFVSGSLADNLRLAAPGASDDDVWAALRRVALAERVGDLPDGLDTELGEDGVTLSSGERARLALARVLVADRPWVMLDEPSAHLDALTERVVVDTVRELGRTRGVVVVAHRPALVAAADQTLRLSEAPAPMAASAIPDVRPHSRSSPTLDDEPATPAGLALSTLLGGLSSAAGVALTATAGWLIVQASYQPAVLTLMVAIVGVRAFGLARPVLRYAERLRSHDVVLRLLARRRVEVYDAVVPLTPGALGRRRGDVLTAVVDDVDSVVDRELRVRLPVRGFVLVAVLATAVAFLLAPVAGPVVAATCATAGGLGFVVARAGATRSERRAVRDRAALSVAVLEATEAATELRMWQAERRAIERVADASDRLGRSTLRTTAWLGCARAVVLAVSGVGVAAMAVAAAAAHADGAISGPTLALLVMLPLALGEAAAGLPDAGALAARTRAAEDRLSAIAALPPAVSEPVAPVPAADGTGITADGVTVTWDGREVLDGLSLRLAAGERVGVVGPSGSGKSTLAALMMRFVDPSSGRVGLGGRDLSALALDDVRSRVGLVDDDPHVFASTLVENVRLARPGAGNAEVDLAIRRAGLGPWLDALPDGLDTWLGDGHAQVSGGERARLAIARSLLADQPILVLDEPTAHLDTATAEQLAAEVLGHEARSVLWITHGTVGLDRVDRVVDLQSS